MRALLEESILGHVLIRRKVELVRKESFFPSHDGLPIDFKDLSSFISGKSMNDLQVLWLPFSCAPRALFDREIQEIAAKDMNKSLGFFIPDSRADFAIFVFGNIKPSAPRGLNKTLKSFFPY